MPPGRLAAPGPLLLCAIDADAEHGERGVRALLKAASIDDACTGADAVWVPTRPDDHAWARRDTPLSRAARRGHARIARLLLEAGAAVDATLEGGATALFVAAAEGHARVVALLLEAGADARRTLDDGATALHAAAHEAVIALLLQAGASPERAAHDGSTPLLLAAQTGCVEACEALLAAHAAVDLPNARSGGTALFYACAHGHLDVVRLLAARGAARSIAFDGVRCSAAQVARDEGHVRVAEWLEATPPMWAELETASSCGGAS